ncbi:hypothetical protein C8Q77DRAFT_1107293 [Trametes polyzona]|nr:hypothetical protein C8Q77DRAFT_1107293 [Trametes polyzona]
MFLPRTQIATGYVCTRATHSRPQAALEIGTAATGQIRLTAKGKGTAPIQMPSILALP